MCLKSIEILQLWRITAAGCLNQRVNLIPRLAPFFNPLHGVDSPKNGTMKTTMAIWCYMYWMYCLSHDLTETDKKNLNCHSNPWKFGRSKSTNSRLRQRPVCGGAGPLSDGTGSLCGTVMTIALGNVMNPVVWLGRFCGQNASSDQRNHQLHHFYHFHSCYFMFHPVGPIGDRSPVDVGSSIPCCPVPHRFQVTHPGSRHAPATSVQVIFISWWLMVVNGGWSFVNGEWYEHLGNF